MIPSTQYEEWIYHLARFAITSKKHQKDTAMYLRRIANKLEKDSAADYQGSVEKSVVSNLRYIASVVPSSILRKEK